MKQSGTEVDELMICRLRVSVATDTAATPKDTAIDTISESYKTLNDDGKQGKGNITCNYIPHSIFRATELS